MNADNRNALTVPVATVMPIELSTGIRDSDSTANTATVDNAQTNNECLVATDSSASAEKREKNSA